MRHINQHKMHLNLRTRGIVGLSIIFVVHVKTILTDVVSKNENRIQVRAVLLNCDPGELQSTYDEMTRFDNEELLKYNLLRDCEKKLGVTIKLTSDVNDESGDVFIPIDHVLYGPKRKRIRLLNPYVLRLRWEPSLQAYKLRKMDTVSGVFTNSDDQDSKDKQKSDRHLRALTHVICHKGDVDSPLLNYEMKPGEMDDIFFKSYDYTKNVNKPYSNITDLMERYKRQEHNVVIEQEYPRDSKYSIFSKYGLTMNLNEKKPYIETYRPHHKKPNFIVDRYKTNIESWIPDADINRNTLDQSTTNNSFFKDKVINDNQNEFDNSFDSAENSYILYEIGDRELLQKVRVQMYEKINNPEGNVVWNDLFKGQIASVSSISPKWDSQNVNMRYQPAEWIPREEFLLPMATNLCLLESTKNSDTVKFSNSDTIPYDNKYVVVPIDDITPIEEVNTFRKRDKSINDSLTTPLNGKTLQGPQLVQIRTARALFGSKAMNINVLLEGAEQYLTIPHKQPHRAQIDLETRADNNQLVCIGQLGRITIAVTDSTRRSRTTLTLQATNTGLAASRFRAVIRDCGPVLSDLLKSQDLTEFVTNPLLIPPKHTRRFELEIPTAIPTDVAHCSVSLINDDNESVAVRDVTIRKGDRCFCVWHCDCVCLSVDPNLICQKMPDSSQIAAGLTLRDRPRSVRSVCYDDSDSINIFVAIFGMLITLLLLGLVKAIIGLLCPCARAWGLTRMFKSPQKLDRYHESSLSSRPVEYDTEGWPVHPDTKKRTVHFCSGQMEFMLNVIYFLVIPWIIICDGVKDLKMHFEGLNQSNIDKPFGKSNKKCFSSHAMQSTGALRSRRQRKGDIRKWMTPAAEQLSTDIWKPALTHRENIKCEFMRPLLHDDCYQCAGGRLEARGSYLDSEQDDTEYVLMQMQNSKDILTKSQKSPNDGH